MKSTVFFLIMALLLPCSMLTAQRNNETSEFIHATYSVESRLKSKYNVDKSDFKDFQFVYFMAAPKWESKDFDLSQKEINKKYVDDHQYKISEKDGIALAPYLIKKVHNDGCKILVSFPGQEFVEIAKDNNRRMKFANMMAAFVKKYNYDGVELDWEHTIDLQSHYLFMKDIRRELNKAEKKMHKKLHLTTALHSYQKYTKQLADDVSKQVDFINIMTYDMGGGIWGKKATHNTPLQDMKDVLKNWEVFNPKKLCIGLATYGFYYKGVTPGETMPESLKNYGRYMDYNELPPLLQKGWTEKYDPVQSVSYYFSPDQKEFVTMDNHRSLKAKMDWVFSQKFRGVFWWEFHTDFQISADGKGSHALMDYVTELIKEE